MVLGLIALFWPIIQAGWTSMGFGKKGLRLAE
jgi:hypothetical protein